MLLITLLITLEIIIHIQDIIDTPNKIAIKIATDYINYVISSRTCGADMGIDICR